MNCFLGSAAVVMTLLLSATSARAQTGTWWIGGEVGYWYDRTGCISRHSYAIAPEAGYDFDAHWTIATTVGFESSVTHGGTASNVLVLLPYASYKFFTSGALTFFVDAGLGIAAGDEHGFRAGFTPGLTLQLSDHLSAQATIGFLGYAENYFHEGDGKGFGFRLDSSDLRFGLFYAF